MRKILYGWMSACLLLGACDTAGEATLLPLEVTAEIAGSPTRAAVDATNYDKSAFDVDDEINISLKGSSSAVKYKRGQNGWLPVAADNGLSTTGNQTYIADYPVTFTEIMVDQTAYTGFWRSNRLQSEATATGNKVSFSFAPVAAKITIVVTYDADKVPAGATVVGEGIRTNNGNITETIKLLRTSPDTEKRRQSYTGIIYPVEGRKYTYSITVSNTGDSDRNYMESNAPALKPGHNYLYTFSATNELILTGVQVLPFNTAVTEDGGSAT